MASDLTRGYSGRLEPCLFLYMDSDRGRPRGLAGQPRHADEAQMGAIANIVAGIVASSLGSGWPARADCPPATLIEGWVIAVRGATLLILLLKVVGIYK